MLKYGSCPYFVAGCGDVYAICLKNRFFRFAQPSMGIEKTTAGLHGERLYMTVEVVDGVGCDVRKFHGKEVVDDNFRGWKVMAELDYIFLRIMIYS